MAILWFFLWHPTLDRPVWDSGTSPDQNNNSSNSNPVESGSGSRSRSRSSETVIEIGADDSLTSPEIESSEGSEESNENLYNTVESELTADMMTTGPVDVDDNNNAVQNNQPGADVANVELVLAEVEVHHQDVNNGGQEESQPEIDADNVNGLGEEQIQNDWNTANEEDPAAVNYEALGWDPANEVDLPESSGF